LNVLTINYVLSSLHNGLSVVQAETHFAAFELAYRLDALELASVAAEVVGAWHAKAGKADIFTTLKVASLALVY